MAKLLRFDEPDIDPLKEFEIRLQLRLKEQRWYQGILSAVPWIQALEPIVLKNEQWVYYASARYFVHHFPELPSFPLPKHDLVPDYPQSIIPSDTEVRGALDWFRDDAYRGQGRSYLLAACWVEMCLANPEYEIYFWDHHHAYGAREHLDGLIKDIAWEILGARKRIVVGRGYLIAAQEGRSEINKRGQIGRASW